MSWPAFPAHASTGRIRHASRCIVRFVFVLLLGVAGLRARAATPPDILFLFADDQRADTIGAWGNAHIRTPNLDRLVAEGFSFRGNYCFGGNNGAVCIPSRAMLMSGRTWFHVDPAISDAPTFPEVLRSRGYTTFGAGKWHNGQKSFVRSFSEGRSVHLGGMADHTKVPVQDLRPDGTFTPARAAARFSSEEFADAAIEFLRRPPDGRPSLAYIAFTAPHDPRNPPEDWRARYHADLPPLPKNYLPQHPFDNGQLVIRDEELLPWPRPPAMVREQLAEYYGLVSHLDAQIGRILAALKASPRGTNTIVIYAADHGLALGSHGLLGKQNVYEHSMRCPLIIAGPGIPAGRSTEAFTYLFDLFPTICGLAGVPLPAGLEGSDLRPIWSGEQERVRDSVFLPYLGLMRSVREGRWKLICYPEVAHRQLFDLQDDPDELVDVSGDPGNAGRIAHLLDVMKGWQARVGDTQPLAADHPKPLRRDLTGRARLPDSWQPAWIVEKYFRAPRP